MLKNYSPQPAGEGRSFSCVRQYAPYSGRDWHIHEQFELYYLIKGSGVRLVGDHMGNFSGSELCLVGPWMPHLWINDPGGADSNDTEYIILKFLRGVSGTDYFSLPELAGISAMLQNSQQGIMFSAEARRKCAGMLVELSSASGCDALVLMLRVLDILSQDEGATLLSSEDCFFDPAGRADSRLRNVMCYISENYMNHISLEDLAQMVSMTPNSFCRFFRERTNKSAIQFIREYRINKACQMLAEGQRTIQEVCCDSGFSSMSNFYTTFRAMKGIAAKQYRNKYCNAR